MSQPRPPHDPYLELADDAAHEAALRSRAESRARLERAERTATWLGTLHDLAERGVEVAVTAASGRRHRGALVGVATDHLALRSGEDRLVLVALDTVRMVRPEPQQRLGSATGDRPPPGDRTLADALDRHVEQRRALTVVLRDVPEPLRGQPVAIGEDVLSLRLTVGDPATVLLPVAAVVEVIVDDAW